uniref:PDZ domain-containing protein n=1 Tax=Panagrolaimus superbus TaxID=310955 RepID=A0A914YX59_9BILA
MSKIFYTLKSFQDFLVSTTLGIQLNDSCVVNSVNREDVDVIFGDLWLEINGIWLEDKKHFTEIYRKMKRETNNSIKLKLKIARLLWKQNLPEDRMPMDILPRREYKYHLALIYGIPKMHLTLALKAINGKVFVSGVSEETLGRMAFSVGDAILDVNNCMVGSITGAYELLKQHLKAHGVGKSHVTFKPTHDVVHINADINPLLLQPVPSHNFLPTDTLLAPGRSAESILSDLSSEATTEEQHQEPKLSKSRPMRQKDCRLTTGTKVIKQKRSTENPKSPIASPTTTGKKSSTPNDSPRDTKDSDSGGKKCPTIMATTKTQTDSGKRTFTTTKTTQNTTDSGKRGLTTLKTQNTDSGRRGSTSKTQSKTPQDTDSKKKTTTTTTNNNNTNTDSRKKNSASKTKTSVSRDNSPRNSNSQR